LAGGQKQIKLTREREAVFTGNHAATGGAKRDKRRRTGISLSAEEFVANAAPVRPHPRADKLLDQAAAEVRRGGIGNSMGHHCYLFS